MSAEARRRVRDWFERAVQHLGVTPESAWGCDEAAIGEVCRVLGVSSLPAAVDEFLRVAGGARNPVEWLFNPEDLDCRTMLRLPGYAEALAQRAGLVELPWEGGILLASSTNGSLLWVLPGDDDPVVWGCLDDGEELGECWASFTGYLEDTLRVDIETRPGWEERQARLPDWIKEMPTMPPEVWEKPLPEAMRVALGDDEYERRERERQRHLEEWRSRHPDE